MADAAAAIERAAAVTASSADRSGTAVLRITHNGSLWAGTTVRWNGDDVAVSSNTPGRTEKGGSELLVVDEVLYGFDPEAGDWVRMGSPTSIDPDSGTTPSEYVAAVREDVGGRRCAGSRGRWRRRQRGGWATARPSTAAWSRRV